MNCSYTQIDKRLLKISRNWNRTGRQLAENRQQLAENRLALNQERLFLNVLCRDYTAVLYVDLNTATVEILKMDQVANAARFISSRNRQKQSYTDIIERYCHSFIVEGQTEPFLHYMSIP